MAFELISSAWAADDKAAMVPAPTAIDTIMQFAPLMLILAIIYFMLIRPQQQRFQDHEKMVKSLNRGDRIITGGGIHGTIVKTEGNDILVVEIADDVRIRVQRGTVASVESRGDTPANSNSPAQDKSA